MTDVVSISTKRFSENELLDGRRNLTQQCLHRPFQSVYDVKADLRANQMLPTIRMERAATLAPILGHGIHCQSATDTLQTAKQAAAADTSRQNPNQ